MSQTNVPADQALSLLRAGNERFVCGLPQRPSQDQATRVITLERGQQPFAIVLACADSRVPVELIFDRGIGDIFTIRVAGNVAGPDQIGSIEYGVEHLGIRLVVVLGHSHCGAVTAAVKGQQVQGRLSELVGRIAPAVKRTVETRTDLSGDALRDECAKANVWKAIEDLLGSPVIKNAIKNESVQVHGGWYDIRSGCVEWMGRHPAEATLVKAD